MLANFGGGGNGGTDTTLVREGTADAAPPDDTIGPVDTHWACLIDAFQ